MKCRKLKLFSLLLVLLCFSFSAYSQDIQADITVTELQTLLTERENFKAELQALRTENESIKQELQTLKAESMNRENELTRLKIESEIRTASLTDLKKETGWIKLEMFGAGFSLGVGAASITALIYLINQ